MKQRLSIEAQIAHLKAKGVRFSIMDEAAAANYLRTEENYFRVAAYRKNYQKHPGGPHQGEYVRLEFAYLVDLATIDASLREMVLSMALQVEHLAKMQILQKVEAAGEDGYAIVEDFVDSLAPKERHILEGEIARHHNDVYAGAMVQKYEKSFPVWVFLELVSFGKLISFYRFCAERFHDDAMRENDYRLRQCKVLRNAAAHRSCILNDISGGISHIRTNRDVVQALARIPGMTKGVRTHKMAQPRIQQLVTLLYTYRTMATQGETDALIREKLAFFQTRYTLHSQYYADNASLRQFFAFLTAVIDNWYGER